jgi:hypothetical protein
LIYENDPPHIVHSVDHGHFFPGGPEWRLPLDKGNNIGLYADIVNGCTLTNEEQRTALHALQNVNYDQIINAVAMPPDEWGISVGERTELVEFLMGRRERLIQLSAGLN